jgi:tRNA uridine 5-carboxymethylaminomethyl modification enzyme
VKYEGYIQRQLRDLKEFQRFESLKIPADLEYSKIPGLSYETIEKLSRLRPDSVGQASRIPGVTPAGILNLLGYLRKR